MTETPETYEKIRAARPATQLAIIDAAAAVAEAVKANPKDAALVAASAAFFDSQAVARSLDQYIPRVK